jgi:hypothetical protein
LNRIKRPSFEDSLPRRREYDRHSILKYDGKPLFPDYIIDRAKEIIA